MYTPDLHIYETLIFDKSAKVIKWINDSPTTGHQYVKGEAGRGPGQGSGGGWGRLIHIHSTYKN